VWQINEWVKSRDPYGKIIPFSASFEATVCAFGDDEAARKAFLAEKKVKSMMTKIITTGYSALDLIQYFTVGEVEVRSWTVKKGTLAPGAAGVIHSDFMKHFMSATAGNKGDDRARAGMGMRMHSRWGFFFYFIFIFICAICLPLRIAVSVFSSLFLPV